MSKIYDPTTDPTNASYKGPNFADWPAVDHNNYGEPSHRPKDFVTIPQNLLGQRHNSRRKTLDGKE
ncbi:MAG TPA: hypothetical protein VHA12_02130 [Candidatus Nanoarchaeia archaeon]|nr:hypothetical protein [Candidatus Nanoarchaeia archaeon]